jgi:hypothetical protein|tara:strand:+ start:2226 stop:2447 length:222 start_codon:yes stop_codon:yes gene_type:complete
MKKKEKNIGGNISFEKTFIITLLFCLFIFYVIYTYNDIFTDFIQDNIDSKKKNKLIDSIIIYRENIIKRNYNN